MIQFGATFVAPPQKSGGRRSAPILAGINPEVWLINDKQEHYTSVMLIILVTFL